MALWRDPLDELIADLEQSVPAESASIRGPTMAEQHAYCLDLQFVVSKSLWPESTDAELDADPEYQEASRRLDAFDAKYRCR